MDQELLQRTRYILRARFRRAQTCPPALFPVTCAQVLRWLEQHPILSVHLHSLRMIESEAVARVQQVSTDLDALGTGSYDPDFYAASTILEHAALCLRTVEAVSESANPAREDFLLRCLAEHLTRNDRIDADDALQVVRDVALDGLFEHLDEHIDARNVTLALLEKYRQRAVWFRRENLRLLSSRDGAAGGERGLALDLYEYLLDQSVEFYIEAATSGGEADVVLRDPNGAHIVLDAKHIKHSDTPSKIKRKLADGFHQVAQYCEDYQEQVGFLVVFSESLRRFAIDLEEADGWRFLKIGSRTIYLTEISIADAPSASKLGKADELSISREDLLSQENEEGT